MEIAKRAEEEILRTDPSISQVSVQLRLGRQIAQLRLAYQSQNLTHDCRVDLAQLIRFLIVELIHPSSNHRFDMCVIFTANYSFR
jgi:hypothetical protein